MLVALRRINCRMLNAAPCNTLIIGHHLTPSRGNNSFKGRPLAPDRLRDTFTVIRACPLNFPDQKTFLTVSDATLAKDLRTRRRRKRRLRAAIQTVAHKTQKPWWKMLKVSHACQLGQAAVGHFHKVPMEQVIGGCWHEQDRGSRADGPVLHWPCIPAPRWGPQEGAEQAPRKNGVPLRPWHCALPSLGLHPSL